MARKPTRFWHPACRVVVRVRNAAQQGAARRTGVGLDDVRPRIQHYLRAMYGHAVSIESVEPPKEQGWTVRVLRGLALIRERATSESDAQHIRLPAVLPGPRGAIPPLEQYRVMAVQHAERIRRGSALHARQATSDLERDLFQLAEAVTIDAEIVASQPGLRPALDAARADAMARRPKPRWRTEIELRVEEMFRGAWTHTERDPEFPAPAQENDAEANTTWARRTANALEARYGRKAAHAYRRVPEITLWQTTIHARLPEEQALALETDVRAREHPTAPDQRTAQSSSAMPGPSQSRSPQTAHSNTPGKSQGDDGSSPQDAAGNDGRSDTADAEMQRTPDVSAEQDGGEQSEGAMPADGARGRDVQSGVGHSGQAIGDAQLTDGITYRYPEWDCHTKSFHPTGTIVRIMPPPHESSEWATSALREHAREVHRARRQFERLRSHRLRLRRQLQGDELDLEACVEAMVDRRMRVAPSDRLYSLVRPGRRELAITLLLDVSGSTGDIVAGEQRVIDIERIAALVATSAFDALGDDYSILAFSSASASNVRVHTLKAFNEHNSPAVYQRISALAPHGNTRLGAAVRHAAAQLSEHPAPHRLLLILSDGKPHDYDWYFVDYAIQDSRHAVMSARQQGIHSFCITVDASEGGAYLAEIFGITGFRVVSKPAQLSQAILQAVQRMIGGNG